MTNIEVNLAGFQFTRCVPDGPGQDGHNAWHISRVHQLPRVHAGRLLARQVGAVALRVSGR
jgi:hypothetical protein